MTPPNAQPPARRTPNAQVPDGQPPDTQQPDAHPLSDAQPPDTQQPAAQMSDAQPAGRRAPGWQPPDTQPPGKQPPDWQPPHARLPDLPAPDRQPPDRQSAPPVVGGGGGAPVRADRAAAWLTAGLGVMVPLQAGAAYERFHARRLVGRIMAGADVDTTSINRVMDVTAAVTIAVAAVVAALTMWWGFRVVALARRAAPGFRGRPAWAVAGWLVPFANLAVPVVVVHRAHRATRTGRTPAAGAVLGCWWASLLASVAATAAAGGWYVARTHELDQETAASYAAADRSLQTALALTGAAALLASLAALLLIVAVRRVTAAQRDWLAAAES